jgi:hypothetical protein
MGGWMGFQFNAQIASSTPGQMKLGFVILRWRGGNSEGERAFLLGHVVSSRLGQMRGRESTLFLSSTNKGMNVQAKEVSVIGIKN